jgi:hypothetical protein
MVTLKPFLLLELCFPGSKGGREGPQPGVRRGGESDQSGVGRGRESDQSGVGRGGAGDQSGVRGEGEWRDVSFSQGRFPLVLSGLHQLQILTTNSIYMNIYIYIYMFQPFVAHVNGIFDQLVLRVMIFSTVYREGSRLMLNLIFELSQFKL